MRVLIIGGTRFTGPRIVRQLTENSHEVAVMHRGQSSACVPGGVHAIVGDRNRLRDHADEIRAFAPDCRGGYDAPQRAAGAGVVGGA